MTALSPSSSPVVPPRSGWVNAIETVLPDEVFTADGPAMTTLPRLSTSGAGIVSVIAALMHPVGSRLLQATSTR